MRIQIILDKIILPHGLFSSQATETDLQQGVDTNDAEPIIWKKKKPKNTSQTLLIFEAPNHSQEDIKAINV